MDANPFAALRARYRSHWDAHQVIADQNARLVSAGLQPSAEQLRNQKKAADALAVVRGELLAAIASGET
jgi:hypothetical protein